MAVPAFLAPLADAPRWQKFVLGALPLALVGGAGYYLAIAPLEARVATLRGQRASQQAEITRMRAMAADLARLRRQATEIERQVEVAKAKLPTEREIPSLYRTLSEAAVQSGLAVTLFQPQGARVRDFYSEIPIALVAEGGYHDVGDFVARVAALARATTIGELKLTGAAAEHPPSGAVAASRTRRGAGTVDRERRVPPGGRGGHPEETAALAPRRDHAADIRVPAGRLSACAKARRRPEAGGAEIVTPRRAASSLGLAIALATWGAALAQTPAVSSPGRAPTAAATAVSPRPPSYDRKSRRDPFQPIETPVIREVKLVVATARLKGIIRGGATRALLETPDGIGYIMQPGDTLAEGRLVEIGTDRVVFRVPFRPGLTTDHVVLRLPID
jgi:type IV pilus assembly protein PilO